MNEVIILIDEIVVFEGQLLVDDDNDDFGDEQRLKIDEVDDEVLEVQMPLDVEYYDSEIIDEIIEIEHIIILDEVVEVLDEFDDAE